MEEIGKPAANGIYVVAAHPNWRESRVNRLLFQVATETPGVTVQDLYASYADYAIAVAREQAALSRAQLVVLLHPVQWYAMPALLKLWVDEVLSYGWAYGAQGSKADAGGRPQGNALHGKDLWLVASTGGPEDSYHPQSYNRYFFDAFLPPYEQTAALCGMRFLPPMILHGAHRVSPNELGAHVETFRQRLQSYPHWPEMNELAACALPEIPFSDRPAT